MSGRTALVTGASRGIGSAIATELASRGWSLVLTARSSDQLEVVRSGLTAPERHRTIPADLTDDGAIERLLFALRDTEVEVLVLNAGTAVSAPLEKTSVEEWDRCMQLNLRAPFLLVRGFLPQLRAARGTIVVIGSIVSTASYREQVAYTASKHGLYGFTKALAKELHPDVRVHSIQPGGVATDLIHTVRPDIDATELIRPSDVAAALVTLLEFPDSAMIDEIRLRRRGKDPWQQG